MCLSSDLLWKLLRYLDHHVSRQDIAETHIKGCQVKKSNGYLERAFKNAFEAFVINAVRMAEGSCTSDRFRAASPGAFILLSGQLVPPGKQQPEGGELLRVKSPLLTPLQLQIRLLRVYRLHISLH